MPPGHFLRAEAARRADDERDQAVSKEHMPPNMPSEEIMPPTMLPEEKAQLYIRNNTLLEPDVTLPEG